MNEAFLPLKEAIDKYMLALPTQVASHNATYDILGVVARNLAYHGVDNPELLKMSKQIDDLRRSWG